MCGISGSNNKETAFKLYQSNLHRGYYSSGALILDDEEHYTCKKVLGEFTKPVEADNAPGIWLNGLYYLYHSRGPTTETREFIKDNNHPFFYGKWIVSHNGIISNFSSLWEKYGEGSINGKTDSSVIPRILNSTNNIKETLEQLEGTFALWIYNTTSREIFITRCGSTLFANLNTGDFSSTEFENSVSLDEGKIYQIYYQNKDRTGIVEREEYKANSPYFVF